jgi:hypothetical protein
MRLWVWFPVPKRASSMPRRESQGWMKSLDKIRDIVRIADATLVVLIGRQLDPLLE